MRRKIAVIGSNSFSGSDFIDLLLGDPANEVIGISRSPEKKDFYLAYKRHRNPSFRFYQIDLNKNLAECFRVLDAFKPAFVVNFAGQGEVAPSWEHPGQWFETNAVAVAHLCNALRQASYLKRYVHMSTPEAYGSCKGIKEDALLNPSTPYAASRAAGDLLVLTLVKRYRFPAVIIRPTNFYGARQQLFKIVPRTIIYAKNRKTIELHGGGSAIKSYIHIRDVSRGFLAAMEKGRNGDIYHLSSDRSLAVRDLVKRICRHLNVSFEKVTRDVAERPGQDASYIIDSSKARRAFGWRPQVPLDDGIRETIAWIEDNWSGIQHEPLDYTYVP